MMIRPVIFLVCRDDDPVEARRIARIADRLNETGVTTKHREEEKLPRINVGTIGHISNSRVNILPLSTLKFMLSREFFPDVAASMCLPVPLFNSKSYKNMLRKENRGRQHEIKRVSLMPRVTKKTRKQRFR